MINIQSSTHSYFSLFYCNNEYYFNKIRIYSVHGAPDIDIEILFSVEKMDDRFYVYIPAQNLKSGDFLIEFSDAYNVVYTEKLRVLDTINTFTYIDFISTFISYQNTNTKVFVSNETKVYLYVFYKVTNNVASEVYQVNPNTNSTPKVYEFNDTYTSGEEVYYILNVYFVDGTYITIKSNTLKHD